MIKRIEKIEDCGNGYGWSIVLIENHPVSGEEFEIAVMQNDKLCYDTDVMPDDPIRGSWDVINEVIEEIVALPKEKKDKEMLGFVEWPDNKDEKTPEPEQIPIGLYLFVWSFIILGLFGLQFLF